CSIRACSAQALWNPDDQGSAVACEGIQAGARVFGAQLQPVEARRPSDIEPARMPGSGQHVRGLYARSAFPSRLTWQSAYGGGCAVGRVFDAILPRAGVVADIGAGFGLLVFYLAVAASDRQVNGVDASAFRIGVPQKTVAEE